jgi:hypothetical protein
MTVPNWRQQRKPCCAHSALEHIGARSPWRRRAILIAAEDPIRLAFTLSDCGTTARQPENEKQRRKTMNSLKLIAIAALLLATGTQSAQALPKCTSKLECDARALNRARNDSRFAECRTSFIAKAIARGDQRMQRIANEYERRGGGVGRGVDAANSLRDNPDWQWAGARASRACARNAK